MDLLPHKYRSSHEYREILRIFQKTSFLTQNLVWQNQNGTRLIVPVSTLEIDFMAREVVLSLSENKHLDPNYPLYVKLDYHLTVFKVTKFHFSGTTVSFEIPKEVKTPELRSVERFNLEESVDSFIYFSPFLNDKSQPKDELKIKILDISRTGMGLLISDKNKSFIRNHRVFWITKIQEETLENPILAEVVYISSEYYSSKDRNYKFGVKLSTPLTLKNLNQLLTTN